MEEKVEVEKVKAATVAKEKVEAVVEEKVGVVSVVVALEVMVELEVVVTQVKMGRDIYYSQPMS